MQPLGIFGGTFDPIHNGHLALIRLALETQPLERVLVLPAGVPPMRAAPPEAAFKHRLRMAQIALEQLPGAEASDLDAPLGAPAEQPSYTYLLLERVRAAHPARPLILLLGADAAARLPEWRRPERIHELAQVVVADRPGHAAAPSAAGSSRQQVSAAAIRAAARRGQPLDQWLPAEVAEYIARHRLYSAPHAL